MLKTKMKKGSFKFPFRRLLTITLFCLLAMGECECKKKVVEAAHEPAPVDIAPTTHATPPAPAADEVAVGELENYFSAIVNASNVQSANSTIQEALAMFSNQNTPVLIVIHEENGVKDYDEPTTIRNYLNYLKDTKKNLNFISDIRLDGSGKVSELELRRR